jgi:hypothetical protein
MALSPETVAEEVETIEYHLKSGTLAESKRAKPLLPSKPLALGQELGEKPPVDMPDCALVLPRHAW